MRAMKLSFADASRLVKSETDYQETLEPGPRPGGLERQVDPDRPRSPGDYLTLLAVYLQRAQEQAAEEGPESGMVGIRKVTAIGLKAIMEHGCPPRARAKKLPAPGKVAPARPAEPAPAEKPAGKAPRAARTS
jgi:hypothetical protein